MVTGGQHGHGPLGHGAALLPGGKTLVVGGFGTPSCELRDPATGTWCATGNLNRARCLYGNVSALADGRVLAAGGYPHTTSCELYDPATGKWARTGELGDEIAGGVLTLLPGGDVLHTGGWLPDNRGGVGTAARYDARTGCWRRIEPNSVPRDSQSATLLRTGQVLVAGGNNYAGPIAICQLYNPTAAEAGEPLFDGRSLAGWEANAPWKVKDGVIVCPTSKGINHLPCQYRIHGPFEIEYDIELLQLHPEDGKRIRLNTADGKRLAMIFLDDVPDAFHLRGQTTRAVSVPLRTGKWYHVRCRLDSNGKLTAWLDGRHKLETTVPVQFPLTLGLECQRSGARFDNIQLREAASAPPVTESLALPQPMAKIEYEGDLMVDTLRDGVRAFGNRKYTLQQIPKELQDLSFIRQNGGAERPYEVRVHEPGTVLATTSRLNRSMRFMQSRGWTLTPRRFMYTGVSDTGLVVWQKQLEAGIEYVPALPGGWAGITMLVPTDLPRPMARIEYGGDLPVDTLRDGALAVTNRRYTFQNVPEK